MDRKAILPIVMLVNALLVGATSAFAQAGRDDGGADIIVFDIVHSNHEAAGRPAGGGGADIIVFDIIDSNHDANGRPAGGGGGDDIVVFDIIDS